MSIRAFLKAIVPTSWRLRYRRYWRLRWLNADTPNNAVAKLHLSVPKDRVISFTNPDPDDPPVLASDGLPLPPKSLTMGYMHDPNLYVPEGQEWADILRDHGSRYSVADEDRVLDWGCSSGRILRHFRPDALRGRECWGADIDARAIRWAQSNLLPLRFVNCSLVPYLPFPDHHFGFIYALSVFTHIEHLDDFWLLELLRIVRPGGLVLVTIFDESTIQLFQETGRPRWLIEEVCMGNILSASARTVVSGRDPTDTFVFYRKEYIHSVWGELATIHEIIPRWAPRSVQSAVLLQKKALRRQ